MNETPEAHLRIPLLGAKSACRLLESSLQGGSFGAPGENLCVFSPCRKHSVQQTAEINRNLALCHSQLLQEG